EGVTTIGDCSFYHCTSLTQADLPNTLVSIGDNAFADCPSLTSVKIPESVTSIGMQAFYGIACIDAVPDGLEHVGANAFSGTQWYDNQPEGLVYAGLVAYRYKGTIPDGTEVVFKDGTKGISGYCFSGQKGMKSVIIPNTITNIETGAFSGCSSLTNVIIPNSVSLIGSGVFRGCQNLESISLGNSVDEIGYEAFKNCKKLKKIIIPNSVSSISSEAFRGCDSLQSVTIGSNVALIWKDVFKECGNLTEVHSEIQNPFAVRFYSYNDKIETPFDYNTRRGYLFVPPGTKEDYMAADVWKDFQHIVCLNEPITALELSPKTAEVLEGGQVTITPTFTPWYATEQKLTWASSDTTIATVNSQGVVTGVKVGTATISATTTDGSDITATCQVTVKPVVATDITLEPLTVTITAGETYEFALTVAPDNATYKAARWTSSDEAVATVDENGVVTGIAAGQVQVTATTIDGTNLSATSVVTVLAPKASSIVIEPDSATLDIGGSVRLAATIAPDNVENKVVLWQSSDEDVAIVTSKGMVYGVGAGQALITATTTDGTELSDTCHVTVVVPFSLSAQTLAVPVNTLRNIPIVVDNHAPVKSFAFTVTMPEGIHFDSDALPAPRCEDFSISTTYNADSTVMRIEGMMTNRAMEAGTAPFVLLPIKSSEYIDNFVLSLSEISFTSTNDGVGTQELDPITVTLHVLDMGDVNGDKKVDVGDVNAIINYILGLETDLTNFGVGDMNDDGKIDVSDVNMVINLILGVG
ncbi:MAG: leucine-rich repeat protein, partial [Muribaculaceae bacterium]|nr:leucine-rich repeat protein [Muribaculaceae bacterium]